MATESAATPRGTRMPFTGDEYLESLRDGREIWLYGERVEDVTTHPAFRNSARSIARLYDGADRHWQRLVHAPVLQDAAQRRGPRARA
jgi:4-hydroxyphenylacetate 3-monooxygenase